MPGLLVEARDHQGTSFVEILQNCIVYNKDVFDDVAAKKTAADTQIHVKHGEPLIYGKDNDKGLRLNTQTLSLETVTIGEDGVTEGDILVHDETNPTLALLLANLNAPTAMGVLLRVEKPAFEESYWGIRPTERRKKVEQLLRQGNMLDRRAL